MNVSQVAVRIVTLGDLRVFLNGEEAAELLSQRQRLAVLIYLALERSTTRDKVIAVFWPNRNDEKARRALNQTLYELRIKLGEEWLDSQGNQLRVTSALEIDAGVFTEAVKRYDLEYACRLYNGAFLDGQYLADTQQFEAWVEQRRSQLRRLHRGARRDLVNTYRREHDTQRALQEAQRWVEIEPLEDEAQHCLIELLAMSDQGAAVQQYESFRRLLFAHGLKPLEQTEEFIKGIRTGKTNVATDPPKDPWTWDERTVLYRRFVSGEKPRNKAAALAAAAFIMIGVATIALPRQDQPPRSIAVLPFENTSANPEATEHFSVGLSEELINRLSHIPELSVVARTSSFAFKGRSVDVREIADQLDVGAVLEGSVRISGDELRVTVQLVSASNGYQLWANTYKARVDDIFNIQEQIVAQIIREVGTRFEPGVGHMVIALDSSRIRSNPSIEAYELYLRGRQFFAARTADDMRRAVLHFQQAIARDSTFAEAWSGLADAHVMSGQLNYVSRDTAYLLAEFAARKAIQLDETLAEAHCSLARVLMNAHYAFDYAERELERAIELSPSYALAHSWYGQLLVAVGRFDEAEREARLAQRLDPLSALMNNNLGNVLTRIGKYERAIEYLHKALELSPEVGATHRLLGDAYLGARQFDKAVAQYEQALRVAPRNLRLFYTASIVAAHTRARDTVRARAAHSRWQSLAEQEPPRSLNWAQIYAALGDRDRALHYLGKVVTERQLLPDNIHMVLFQPYESDPRYQRLLQQLGITTRP